MADAQFSLVSASDETRDFPLSLSFSLCRSMDAKKLPTNFANEKSRKKRKRTLKNIIPRTGLER